MLFISLTSFRWPSPLVTRPRGKKFPRKKLCYGEFFASMQSSKDMDNVLDFGAEETLAALFNPETVATAEY